MEMDSDRRTEPVYLATTSYRVYSRPRGFHIEHDSGNAGDLSYPSGNRATFSAPHLVQTLTGPLPVMLEQAAALLAEQPPTRTGILLIGGRG